MYMYLFCCIINIRHQLTNLFLQPDLDEDDIEQCTHMSDDDDDEFSGEHVYHWS